MYRAVNGSGRRFGQFFALGLLWVWSAAAVAAGLGDIQVESGLNQPFLARIEVLASSQETPSDWTVELVDADRYASLGLRFPGAAKQMRVGLSQLANGKTEIVLEGQLPVTELIFDIVVSLNDGHAWQLRHYPVLVSFPQISEPIATIADPPVVPRPHVVIPRTEPQQVQYQAGEGIYGPVRPGESLWLIANNARDDYGLSLQDLMAAIFQLNPDAFIGGDIDRLKVGVPLVLPDRSADDLPAAPSASTIPPESRSPDQSDQSVSPDLQRSDNDRSIDAGPEIQSGTEPVARLELQGAPEIANVVESLYDWLSSDRVQDPDNLFGIRRDLSFAAAEIETYRNQNSILRTRVDDLELQAARLQNLLNLQTESLATARAARAPLPSEDASKGDSPTDPIDPGWAPYALSALMLLVLFVWYMVVRNIREEQLRKEKTADLVNRIWVAGKSKDRRESSDL